MQTFNDNNVSFVVRGGLQVLVMLADPNAGTVHLNAICITSLIVCFLKLNFLMFLLIIIACYWFIFQGLGLISNDSTATAAETGALMNHTPAAFYMDALTLSIPVPFPFLTNPNLRAVPCCAFSFTWISFAEFKAVNFSVEGGLFQEKLRSVGCVELLSTTSFPSLPQFVT